MPDQIEMNPINDESSAEKFGDRPALLSENPNSNEAAGGTMNTTTQAPTATLDEAELFAEFYESEISSFNKRGKELFRHNVADLLSPCGDYCEIDFRVVPGDENMSDHLEEVENELLGALANLRLVRKAWDNLKDERLINEDSAVERFTVAAAKEDA